MTVDIHNIYLKYGLLILQNLQIGTSNKVSDFNFFKLSQLDKIINSKNVNWNKLSKNKEIIISQINDLSLI